MVADWLSEALCNNHVNQSYWISSNYEEIKIAKSICEKCPVRLECLYSAIYEKSEFVGVNGGLSEIEFLIRTWEEAESEDETNWKRSDQLIQGLFREIA
jgi:hypothetical protein